MGAVSDAFGHNAIYGFILATAFAAILFFGTLYNLFFNPTKQRFVITSYSIHYTKLYELMVLIIPKAALPITVFGAWVVNTT